MNDIVVDSNVAAILATSADIRLKGLLTWLIDRGHLAVSQYLLKEYYRQGSQILAALVRDLDDASRLHKIPRSQIDSFTHDKHYHYKCNGKDIPHARTVFLSRRKLLVSFDVNLRGDVNAFNKLDKVKPRAFEFPPADILP